MVQWVKNPSAVTQVTLEVQVRSPALHSGLKDPTLLQLRFDPWHRNFYMPWMQPLKKKENNNNLNQNNKSIPRFKTRGYSVSRFQSPYKVKSLNLFLNSFLFPGVFHNYIDVRVHFLLNSSLFPFS